MFRWSRTCWLVLTVGMVLVAGYQTSADSYQSDPPAGLAAQCRDRNGFWEPEVFRLLTCASCYDYLFWDLGRLVALGGWLRPVNATSPLLPADVNNATLRDVICQTLDDDGCFRWEQCCHAAEDCCTRQRRLGPWEETSYNKSHVTTGACPRTWDGYACWDDTPAGTSVFVSCPGFIPHALPGVDAYKTCNANSTWYHNVKTGLEWTNYTDCLNVDSFKRNILVNIACNSLSLLLLVPSVAVFLAYRQLRSQHRIRLHINLFASFVLTNVVFILWDVLIVYDRLVSDTTTSRMHGNSAGCKLLYVLTRYTRCSNFLWMLSEAYYLHRLISKAFEPPKSLIPFYLLAWGFPWIPVSIYSILRAVYADQSCWVQNFGLVEWLIYTPNLLSLATNVFFLSNILRILLTQLQAHPNEPSNYRRALRATFVLIPLFGIQLVFIIYRPPSSVAGATEYAVFESIVTHSQGFFVALVFCCLNGEVLSHLRASCRPACGSRRTGWDTKHSMSTQLTQADTQPTRQALRLTPSPNSTTYIRMKPMGEGANGQANQ